MRKTKFHHFAIPPTDFANRSNPLSQMRSDRRSLFVAREKPPQGFPNHTAAGALSGLTKGAILLLPLAFCMTAFFATTARSAAFTCKTTTIQSPFYDPHYLLVDYETQNCSTGNRADGYYYLMQEDLAPTNVLAVDFVRPDGIHLEAVPIINFGPCFYYPNISRGPQFKGNSKAGAACGISYDYDEVGTRFIADFTMTLGVGEGVEKDRLQISDLAARTLSGEFSMPTKHAGQAFAGTLTFSETMTGVEAPDFNITDGTISNFSGSGKAYDFVVTPKDPKSDVTIELRARTSVSAKGDDNPNVGPFTVASQ